MKMSKTALFRLIIVGGGVLFGILALFVVEFRGVNPNISKRPLTAEFQEGVNYQLIEKPVAENKLAPGRVQVLEFFSYGCPACNRLDPEVRGWLLQKPEYVDFQRIPVVFEPGWELLAKTYYTAKALGVLSKVHPALFDAIHKQQTVLDSTPKIEAIFVKQGVAKDKFESAFYFSPGIDMQVLRGDNLMRAYGIMQIPTFVVNGKYKTSIVLVDGDTQKLFRLLDYLIKLEKQSFSSQKG